MLGLRPAWLWATSLMVAELVGGVLMAVGLLGALGPILVAGTMLGATVLAHWGKGPWLAKGGYELTLTNLAVAAGVALIGVGRYSLDAWLGLEVPLVALRGRWRAGRAWRGAVGDHPPPRAATAAPGPGGLRRSGHEHDFEWITFSRAVRMRKPSWMCSSGK